MKYMRIEFYNGILYKIECVYSNPYYGHKALYRVYTDESNYSIAKKAVLSYLNTNNKPNKGLYDLKKSSKEFSITDWIRGFYIFKYNEQENCFEYYEEEGYDD
jgi:hypothetical protein